MDVGVDVDVVEARRAMTVSTSIPICCRLIRSRYENVIVSTIRELHSHTD
jgi:hypothetical protein